MQADDYRTLKAHDSALRDALAAKDKEIERLKAKVEEKDDEIENLEGQIEELYESLNYQCQRAHHAEMTVKDHNRE